MSNTNVDIRQNFSEHLFWDVNPSNLDAERNKKLVIERVIQRGSRKDLDRLLRVYDRSEIRDTLKQVSWLDEKDMAFVHVFFDIPYNEMKCCSRKPYNRYY